MSTAEQHTEAATSAEEKRTGYIELFFDLVFVFAFTQVTTLIVEDTSAAGLARAALIFALVWWSWSAYAWMTNAVDIENLATRGLMLGAMLASFSMALAIPDAYGDEGVWFAVPYFVVRVLQVALYLWGVREDHQQRAAVALIVIIALGESIVAVGLAAEALERDGVFALAVAVAFVGAAASWWAYFDLTQVGVEHALRSAGPERRGPFARDVFTFFHYPIVLGIILLAVAAKKTLSDPTAPLSDGGRAALGLGLGLFLIGFVLVRLRAIRRVAWERLAAAAAALLAALVLADLDALTLLSVFVCILIASLAVEHVRLHEARAQLRNSPSPH